LADFLDMTELVEPVSPADGTSYEARKRFRRGLGSAAVEVRVRAERRRSWSAEDKLRIVRETLEPGAMAQAVAARHGISTGLLFTWRKQMLTAAMSGFVPVEVRPEALPAPSPVSDAAPTGGDLQVLLPGGAELRFSGTVSPALLREILAALSGR
jgi:transposase